MPFCTNCGHAFLEEQRYCFQCGVLLPGAAPEPAPPAFAARRTAWVPRTHDAHGRAYSAGRLAGHWEFASFGDRFGAALVDGVIVVTLTAVAGRAELALAGEENFSAFLGLLYQLAGNSYGRTVGKHVLGIEIVNHEWKRPGLGKGLLRTIVGVIGQVMLLLGYLNVLWDAEKRGWHDHAADTWVIKRDRLYEPTQPAADEPAIETALRSPAGVDDFRAL
jgi:uncharacterized RDD family membrane protein YckC